jgi:hypothetical protein
MIDENSSALEVAQANVREASAALLASESSPNTKLARAYSEAWFELLKLYAPLPSGDASPVGLPPDLAVMLRVTFDYLRRGIIPETIRIVAAGSARRVMGPAEERDVRIAVAYVDAAKQGKIADRSPIKTVQDNYGIARTAVQGWNKAYAPWPFANIKTLQAAFEIAGRRYQQAGRAHSAQDKRGRKPVPK